MDKNKVIDAIKIENVEKVIENYSYEKERAIMNSHYVRERYNINNMTEELLKIYKD